MSKTFKVYKDREFFRIPLAKIEGLGEVEVRIKE